MGERRASSTNCTPPGCSGHLTAPSRATFWWASMSWIESAARACSVRARASITPTALVAALAASALSAQLPTDSVVPRQFRLDGSLVRAGQLVYQTSVERDSIPPVVG